MRTAVLVSVVALLVAVVAADVSNVFVGWYCADDGCEWAAEPNLDNAKWILDRGDGNVTFNVVVFAFIDPLAFLTGNLPAGFTSNAINFFKNRGITVMFSIGGEVYSSNWDKALQTDASGLGRNAAAIAKRFGVGFEIDYEVESGGEKLLTQFVQAYRSVIPYDGSANPAPESILTVDLAAGTGYLSSVSIWASTQIGTGSGLNWAYAMVSSAPWNTLDEASTYWQQHLDGTKWNNLPPIPAQYLAVSLYSSSGATTCKAYQGTVLEPTVGWVKSKGARGIAFWAVGCPASPTSCTYNCNGIQQGSKAFLTGQSGTITGNLNTNTNGQTNNPSTSTTGQASTTSTTSSTSTTTSSTTGSTTSTSSQTNGNTNGATDGSSTSGANGCASKTGMFCADSSHFTWCPQQITQSCAPGTRCIQNGNSILCG